MTSFVRLMHVERSNNNECWLEFEEKWSLSPKSGGVCIVSPQYDDREITEREKYLII